MFNKFFEKLAEKQLTMVTPLDRMNFALNNWHYKKIGAVEKLSSGIDVIDMSKVRASNLKMEAIYFGVIIPAAAIIGHISGKHS